MFFLFDLCANKSKISMEKTKNKLTPFLDLGGFQKPPRSFFLMLVL